MKEKLKPILTEYVNMKSKQQFYQYNNNPQSAKDSVEHQQLIELKIDNEKFKREQLRLFINFSSLKIVLIICLKFFIITKILNFV